MKKNLLFLLVILNITNLRAQDFITIWDLNNYGPSAGTITFGVGTTGVVNYTWETIPVGFSGFGTFSSTSATISGLPPGTTIRLKIDTANFNSINNYFYPDINRLIDVEQWGAVKWATMNNAFWGCQNLIITATDVPDLSLVTDMSYMFSSFNHFLNGPQNINTWNTSNVTNMAGMFSQCDAFNQPLDNWNTSNVTNMKDMFYDAAAFNQPLGNWNTSNVTDMSKMFVGATFFNQPLGNWNTSNVTDMNSMFAYATSFDQPLSNWNTSNVTDMHGMFYDAISFNQSLSNWNTSNVTDMSIMFYYATSFNQSLGTWKLISIDPNLLSLQQMLYSTAMDCANYASTLQGWASDPSTPSNLILGANGIHYGTNALSDRNYLVNGKFWTINGDTLDNAFCCIPTNETLLETACNSYFFNGQTLTSNGTYTANFINAAGCDSIVTIYLTLNQSSSSTIIQSVCNSYVFNGQTLTSSGTYVDTLSNAVDCDSIVTLILTILHNSTAISQTACNSYFFNGQTLTSSGTYTDTLVNTAGCDSLITLNLTITQVNTSTSQSGFVISSNANGATYQWVKCPSYSIIPNETSQTYTAAANGSFAVIVTQNGCTDTSNCVTVTGVGINEHEMDQTIYVYPNPTNGIFTIQKQDPFNGPSSIRILDVTGQVIYTSNFNRPTTQYTINISNQPAGIYLVELKQDEEIARVKVVKE